MKVLDKRLAGTLTAVLALSGCVGPMQPPPQMVPPPTAAPSAAPRPAPSNVLPTVLAFA